MPVGACVRYAFGFQLFLGQFRVPVADLKTGVAATTVDYKPGFSSIIAGKFDKMVAPTKATKAPGCLVHVYMPCATQFIQPGGIKTLVRLFMSFEACWHLFPDDFVQLPEIRLVVAYFGSKNSTANVNTYKIWNYLAGDGHSQADHTAFARMKVWHDPYGAAFCRRAITQLLHLSHGILVNAGFRVIRGIDLCRTVLSLNLNGLQNSYILVFMFTPGFC